MVLRLKGGMHAHDQLCKMSFTLFALLILIPRCICMVVFFLPRHTPSFTKKIAAQARLTILHIHVLLYGVILCRLFSCPATPATPAACRVQTAHLRQGAHHAGRIGLRGVASDDRPQQSTQAPKRRTVYSNRGSARSRSDERRRQTSHRGR